MLAKDFVRRTGHEMEEASLRFRDIDVGPVTNAQQPLVEVNTEVACAQCRAGNVRHSRGQSPQLTRLRRKGQRSKACHAEGSS